MQKEPLKVLVIGSDEGPKKWFTKHLFNIEPDLQSCGITLKMKQLDIDENCYIFWCVDSYELTSYRDRSHYYQNAKHILVIPKDEEDLGLITEEIESCIPSPNIIICKPSNDFIKTDKKYPTITTNIATQDFTFTPEKLRQFISLEIPRALQPDGDFEKEEPSSLSLMF